MILQKITESLTPPAQAQVVVPQECPLPLDK